MLPSGTIYLCKNTNLELRGGDYDTIYFATKTEKREWFASHVQATFTNQQYTRGGNNTAGSTLGGEQYSILGRNTVRVQKPIGDINMCDYMYYIEPNYENRYFYCFITDIRYVNDNVTEVEFVEDAFMTWCNDMVLGDSMVQRESTSTDEYYDEQNEIADFGVDANYHTFYTTDIDTSWTIADRYICVTTNQILKEDGSICDKIVTPNGTMNVDGLNDFSMNCGRPDNLFYYIADLTNILACQTLSAMVRLANQGNIVGIAPINNVCLPASVILGLSLSSSTIAIVTSRSIPAGSYPNGSSISTFKTYNYLTEAKEYTYNALSLQTVRSKVFENTLMLNKKMYNSPYCNIRITNNYGGVVDLKPELVGTSGVSGALIIHVRGYLYVTPKVELTVSYDNSAYNPHDKLTLAPPMQIPFSTDVSQEWYRENAVSATVDFTMGIATLGAGLALSSTGIGSLTGFGMVTSGLSQTLGTVGEMWKVEHLPMSTTGGSDAGVSSQCFNWNKFTIQVQSIPRESARTIDAYFTKYGYAVNKIKSVPFGLNGRTHFYYVKTDNLTIKGNVPMYAKQTIKRLYDKGIRLWNKSNYLDYSAGNLLESRLQ